MLSDRYKDNDGLGSPEVEGKPYHLRSDLRGFTGSILTFYIIVGTQINNGNQLSNYNPLDNRWAVVKEARNEILKHNTFKEETLLRPMSLAERVAEEYDYERGGPQKMKITHPDPESDNTEQREYSKARIVNENLGHSNVSYICRDDDLGWDDLAKYSKKAHDVEWTDCDLGENEVGSLVAADTGNIIWFRVLDGATTDVEYSFYFWKNQAKGFMEFLDSDKDKETITCKAGGAQKQYFEMERTDDGIEITICPKYTTERVVNYEFGLFEDGQKLSSILHDFIDDWTFQ